MNHENTADCVCDSCCGIYTRRREREQEAQDVAATVASFLNHSNAGDLAKAMATQHRTLQQLFTGVCVAWLEHLAALPDGHYDGRNEASVRLARAIVKTDAWQCHNGLPYV